MMRGLPRRSDERQPEPGSADMNADVSVDRSVDLTALVEHIGSLTFELTKVRAEATQTADALRRMETVLGQGADAIRREARADAVEALTRSHSAVALARIASEADRGDAELAEAERTSVLLRRIEMEVAAELIAVGIEPLVPEAGDPIDERTMQTRGGIPDSIDPATVTPYVERVLRCGYRRADRTVLPMVTVRWSTPD
jgi:hypothetical protein